MARQSVVLAPPPRAGARQVVLLREGPPQRDRRRWLDASVGTIGGILLLLAVVLVPMLPQDEVLPDQYEVAFVGTVSDDTEVRSFVLGEGESVTVPIAVDDPFVYRIDVFVEWLDDAPSSLADVFAFTLVAPDGTEVVGPVDFANPEPESDGAAVAPIYTPFAASRSIGWDLAPSPTTRIETAATGEDEAAVTARVMAAARTDGTGEWGLVATLVDAGDCPDPTTLDINRFFACESASGGAPDIQNAFQVVKVSMLRYEPVLTLLES